MNQSEFERNIRPAPPAGLIVLLAVTVILGAVALYYGYQIYDARKADPPRDPGVAWPLAVWSSLQALALALAALTVRSSKQAPAVANKLSILAIGGIVGCAAVFLGAFLVYDWWSLLTSGREAWKQGKTWVPVLLMLGGLAAMFVSLLAVRSEERSQPLLRRLVYGFNAVLTGFLVMAILAVANVFAFFYFTHAFDWTSTTIYSISPQSQAILKELDKPVKVHILILPTDPLFGDVVQLLANCKSYTNKLDIEAVTTRREIADLIAKYELLDNTAILVVYDPDGKPVHHSIKPDELEDLSSRFSSREQTRSFMGERAIVSAISFLQEGKVTKNIYFTQDSGELKLTDMSRQPDRGIGALKARLEKSNYSVKELKLGELDAEGKPTTVPSDAAALVLAAPREMTKEKAAVIEEYLKRDDARLIVLLDVQHNRDWEVQPTGLEGLLAKYGVQVGKDVVLKENPRMGTDPLQTVVIVSDSGDAALREAYPREQMAIPFDEIRSVRAMPNVPDFTVAPFLETPARSGQWAEEGVRGSPQDFIRLMKANDQQGLLKKQLGPAVPVAVTVREKTKSGAPNDQAHAALRADGKPKMVVFGDASFVSNPYIEGAREIYYSLFASALSWLRERQGVITDIPIKERKAYRLTLNEEQSGRVRLWPGLLMLVGVVACGIGVWFFRRR